MKLKRAEIQGFKSFAHNVRLDFDDGMTAVIGPNGSGKSNLAEAIRWVLGEQSTKQLRGKASTDVIFSGADSKQKASRAFVRLTFDNESGRFPIEAAEVAVARSLSRSGESEYSINGDPVRLIDLQRMLAEAGIGAKTYTVISQGMVDRYLSATPAGRRELFDEATGIRAMQIKLGEAAKKIKAAQHHAHEVEMVIHELEPRLAVLGRQIRRHHERQELQKIFTEKQTQWFHHTWHEFNQNEQTSALRQQELQDRIATARSKRKALEKQLLSSAAQKNSQTDVLHEKLSQAKREYAEKTAAYTHAVQHRHKLELSLREVQQHLATAEKTLAQKREASGQTDWLQTTRNALMQSQQILRDVLTGSFSKQHITDLLKVIETALERTSNTTSVDAAHAVLEQLEKPIQEVARLKAIEKERATQLSRTAIPEKPSSDAISALEQAIAAASSTSHATANASPADLDAAREEELAAEREASVATVATQQAHQELHGLEQEILREQGTQFLNDIRRTPPTSPKPSDANIRELSERISRLGEIDELTLKEYEEAKERYDHLTHQLNDIRATERNIEQLQTKLRREMDTLFTKQFAVIQSAFSTYFITLFGGGKATLSLSEDGVEISAVPPGKHPRHISLLSGGERALTSLALLLAIIEAQKPPFIVLDEVDAALDESNSKHLSEALREKSGQTQCIVITHNRQTMSAADVLYGVTMQQDSISKIYSVSMRDIQETALQQSEKEQIGV